MITADCLRVSCSFAQIIRILPYLIVVCTLEKLFPVPFSATFARWNLNMQSQTYMTLISFLQFAHS